jgi:hypothetical protein
LILGLLWAGWHLHPLYWLAYRPRAVVTALLQENDIVVVEPGEAHTFLSSSSDHAHVVIQTPGLQDEAGRADKVPMLRSRLGLTVRRGTNGLGVAFALTSREESQ